MDNHEITGSYDKLQSNDFSSAFSRLMRNVYLWMTLGLVMTGLTAMYIAKSESLIYAIFGNQAIFWVLMIAELVLVVVLSAAINRLSFAVAGLMFAVYSVLNGATLSVIFLAYTEASIAQTFFVTAGTFGAMSVFGYFTKRDLSPVGRVLVMALIGLIIASVVNIFFRNSVVEAITNYAGVVIFVGLTAYDTQKIKQMLQMSYEQADGDTLGKIALMGSLTLYLDFVNLFLHLLQLIGRRK